MLKLFTKNFNLDDNFDFEKLATKCDKMSGAYIADLCVTATIFAVRDKSYDKDEKIILKDDHLFAAIDELKNKDYTEWGKEQGKRPMGFGQSS